ncbi:MAG TPA: hypothetical protein VJY41_04775 [Prolixibacteraceae bacterium]|nr:hypothetical protein [Prolixibacteraceae bacterium]
MKRLFFVLAMLAITSTVFAQQTIRIDDDSYNKNEIKTLFKPERRDGFYFGTSMAYSPINKTDGLVASARMGWIMDRWFAFGLSGSAFAGNINKMSNVSVMNDDFSFLAGAYGGVFIEPILMPLKPVHLSFPIVVGGGGLANLSNYYYSNYSFAEDVFFVAEPGIELEINFTRWLRFALFGTYRYTSNIEIKDIRTDALRSYSVGASLKIGWF